MNMKATRMPEVILQANYLVTLWASYEEVKAYARQLERENLALKERLSLWARGST